ncbi:alpha-glucan water dikinase, chloroplastic isoform X2 [Phalaenopsis equestris]|uniref:alpha-glucan water dikinase, chloroplastic isoform X2 n=1 Tax=Phalaenopsis equestris TaxID=78828 RepID=UPI0009E4647A|nr:alpha-glucan water dikinase, chloroplastic isoform X2 [Phalaenopsis equestris]
MSNTLGAVQQNLCRSFVLENPSDTRLLISSSLPCKISSYLKNDRAFLHKQRLRFSTRFLDNSLRDWKAKFQQKMRRVAYMVPHAVLATDSFPKLRGKFKLDGNSELQIVLSSKSDSLLQIDFQITNGGESLVLHWGAVRTRNKDWSLPSRRPDRTKVYKNEALRTPFVKSGSSSLIKLEIDDPEVQAIEFLILDEAQNKWFKNDGHNFHIQLSGNSPQILGASIAETINVTIPEDLVEIYAYLRWEKKGRQNYTPEQEKLEFEEARKELQLKLEKGTSLDEIRKRIVKGSIKSQAAKKLEDKQHFTIERVLRKSRDLTQFINKNSFQPEEGKAFDSKRTLTTVELWSKGLEERFDGLIITRKLFKLDDMELMVLVANTEGKMKVFLGTDYEKPLLLHWALSEKAGEWMVPPSNSLPPNAVLLDKACQAPFINFSSADPALQLQQIEINIDAEHFDGMPFVLCSGDHWIKNNDSDFYVEFGGRTTKFLKGVAALHWEGRLDLQDVGDGKGTAKALLDKISQLESEAQKSFMHRFNIASDLLYQARDAGLLGLAGILVWMRFMATRQLVWNKNYNVKPREISKAQDRLTDMLQDIYSGFPSYREILRIIMSTVGRGGEGDVGQRIRDEILVIQRNNDCKGGMMEEWHQKLHNNTSPDDVVICQALIDYVKFNFDVNVYWKTLNENGITKERLLSYDRAIHSEPNFRPEQKEGLLRDLGNYMRTLKAVHSGADLESAIATCLGYKSEGEGFMVGVQINPIKGLASGFPELLEFILAHIEDKTVEPLLEALLEARVELRPLLLNSQERLKDIIFLDIALDSAVRTAIERGYEELNNAEPEKIMYFISLVLENLALSSDNNEDLIYCLKGWNHALELSKRKDNQWALFAKAFLDRTRLALSSKAEYFHQILQPSAEYLGSLLGVNQWAVNIFTEEIIRAGSAAALSTLLNRIDPILRKLAQLGSWQIISPAEVSGYIVTVNELLSVQNKSYDRPTILVAKSVKGEEEIPDGAVAVLTSDMPDVLSHVSVRARNSKVCFATCFDPNILAEFERNVGKLFFLKPTSAEIIYSEITEGELTEASSRDTSDGRTPSLNIVRKSFAGQYAIVAEEFTNEMVGAKSRNISFLKGKVPSWIEIPTSIALPFGVFEKVLSDNINKDVAHNVDALKRKLEDGDFNALGEIRGAVLQLEASSRLITELKEKMKISGMPWPGDEGEHRWERAWMAIKKVWASKWNERAYFSTRKVKLDHDSLCMAVLVQEIINADYAFVIHTTNPSSGDSSEIYAEVVKGLGETLVGAYPGRALSFICNKNDLNSPKVIGFPSKPIGLFIKRSIIFRSDSNGEDLEGYAGAGLYDSVPMDEEEAVVLDYTSDPLIMDGGFRQSILASIARAGGAIEELYGSPQDIEGVVKDGKIFVVQTRPQM